MRRYSHSVVGLIVAACLLPSDDLPAQSYSGSGYPANGYPGSNEDDAESELTFFALAAAGVAAATPFWGPIVLTHDNYAAPGYFPEYPYQHGMSGNMMIDDPFPAEPFTWSMQAKTEYASNFIGFSRVDTSLLLEGTPRFGLDTEFNYWTDNNPVALHGSNFWTGDANAVFRFAQSDWLQVRAGVGVNWLTEDGNSDSGFNFTYLADLFLGDPLIVSGEFDWGTLGHETLIHTRLTTGAQWHRAEVYVGYDYFDIGPTQTNSVIAGFRFWN